MLDPLENATSLLRGSAVLTTLADEEIETLATALQAVSFSPGEIVFSRGDTCNGAYFLIAGTCCLTQKGRVIKTYSPGDVFGEVALVDSRPRTGTIVATTDCVLGRLSEDTIDLTLPRAIAAKLYRIFGKLFTGYIRENKTLFQTLDVLLIQDGGCAPGYNPVTAYLSEYLEKAGRTVFVATAGFRSLLSNQDDDYRCLVFDKDLFNRLDHVPGVMFSPPLREARGADFRSERFPEFKDPELQETAAANLLSRQVKVLVGVGGNGTFQGIRALSNRLGDAVQTYFVPVTIDSDISGTQCIGEYTGVEVGAEKIRCYMADARTHRRLYIIELMGSRGGYHALHSCLGAGAHLAVLPEQEHDMAKLIPALNPREGTVIVVATGYKLQARRDGGFAGNAAEYFRDELVRAGLDTRQKIVCESFSRDIRGASPNNLDVMLSQRMARKLTQLLSEGLSNKMPSVISNHDGAVDFSEIQTDNSVRSGLASLANRLY